MKPTMEQYLQAIEEVNKSDIPAYLRKAKGEAPLTKAELDAEKEKNLSHSKQLAKNRGVDEAVKQSAGDDSMPNAGPDQDVCPKCKKSPCECDSVEEELKGGQVKLDKNKNGKLDADDFKKLRNEEQEPPFDKPYTTVKTKKNNGAQIARALAQKALKTAIIKGHERYTSSKDNLKSKQFGMAEEEDFSEEELDSMINEVLSKDAKAGEWIHDFVHSDNPKFAGKSKQKRKEMALAAYYAKQRNEEVELTEDVLKHVAGKHGWTVKQNTYGAELKHPKHGHISINRYGEWHHLGNEKKPKGNYSDLEKHLASMKEEVEQISELNKKTLRSYRSKAALNRRDTRDDMSATRMSAREHGYTDDDRKELVSQQNKVNKRSAGISAASSRINKEEVEVEEGYMQMTSKDRAARYHAKYPDATDHEKDLINRGLGHVVANARNPNGPQAKSAPVRKEEVELHEASHRDLAAQGKMHPDMAKHMTVGNEMDFYAHGTGDKMSGKVVKNDGKSVHIKTTHNPYKEKDSSTHKFTISSKLDESSDNVTPYVKTQNYSWGKMKTIHHGSSFSIPLHPEHHEAIAKLEHGQEHKFKDETGRHWTARRDGHNVHFQGANGGNSTTVSHASMREETEGSMITFKDFITEMEFVNGRYVHKGKYGTSYDDPEGKEDNEKPAAEKAEKRGRGRPAGSKSGARQIGGASKKGSGVEYTGYKLHLPNSNK